MLGNKYFLNFDVFIFIENFRKYNEKGMVQVIFMYLFYKLYYEYIFFNLCVFILYFCYLIIFLMFQYNCQLKIVGFINLKKININL